MRVGVFVTPEEFVRTTRPGADHGLIAILLSFFAEIGDLLRVGRPSFTKR